MEIVKRILQRKPFLFLLITGIYFLLVSFLKWNIHPSTTAIFFLLGGVLGIYFLDAAEVLFQITPSPFRTIVFLILFMVVSFFIITSSGAFFAVGLVLSLYLSMLLWQLGEWKLVGNLNSWYRMIADPVPQRAQLWILVGSIVFFLFETFVFIR